MADSYRTDGSRAIEAASDPDRDAKIEQLLLAGLDHYFSARYDQAINVWTRALFFDRSHPRARAYIERARSALAERQRESEEFLHNGIAALDRGERAEARRLLQAAIDRGAHADDARDLFNRLNHELEADTILPAPEAILIKPARSARAASAGVRTRSRTGFNIVLALTVVAAAGLGAYTLAGRDGSDWRARFDLQSGPVGTAAPAPAREVALPLPRRGEIALARARTLAAGGRLREALAVIETVRPADPQKTEADRLRSDIQRQLLGLVTAPRSTVPARDPNRAETRQP
jgi:hypothetical protein